MVSLERKVIPPCIWIWECLSLQLQQLSREVPLFVSMETGLLLFKALLVPLRLPSSMPIWKTQQLGLAIRVWVAHIKGPQYQGRRHEGRLLEQEKSIKNRITKRNTHLNKIRASEQIKLRHFVELGKIFSHLMAR